jgi:hypothetical protein
VLISGFIITGTDPKRIAIRALGPSLAANGLANLLADPVLELRRADGSTIVTNDSWQSDAAAAELTSNGVAPANSKEAATIQTLAPGAYTAIVRGTNSSSGMGLVELYDLSPAANSLVANISTRGFVDIGDNVLIGGFIVGPGSSGRVAVRAMGPSLANVGITEALADPVLEIHDNNGALMKTNDNWLTDASAAELQAAGLAPANTNESAMLSPLTPGMYTAIVRGQGSSTGVALVEAYNLP